MKILLLIILAIGIIDQSHQVTERSCNANLACKATDLTNDDQCLYCFGWGSGRMEARALRAPGSCTERLPKLLKVTDCKYYKGHLNTGATMDAVHCQ
jgi:hypothetical protein